MIHPIYRGRFCTVQRHKKSSEIPILTIKHIGHVISSSGQLLHLSAANQLRQTGILWSFTQSIGRRNNEIHGLHEIKSYVMFQKVLNSVITMGLRCGTLLSSFSFCNF